MAADCSQRDGRILPGLNHSISRYRESRATEIHKFIYNPHLIIYQYFINLCRILKTNNNTIRPPNPGRPFLLQHPAGQLYYARKASRYCSIKAPPLGGAPKNSPASPNARKPLPANAGKGGKPGWLENVTQLPVPYDAPPAPPAPPWRRPLQQVHQVPFPRQVVAVWPCV